MIRRANSAASGGVVSNVAELTERSGVSRAMIGKIERGDAQPTAPLLARVARGCDLTLSRLIQAAEARGQLLLRHDEQTTWRDPATGYTRRAISPAAQSALELAEIQLSSGAVIDYPPDSYPITQQQVWMIDGELDVTQSDGTVRLTPGDCLHFGRPGERRYRNPGTLPCRYLVAAARP